MGFESHDRRGGAEGEDESASDIRQMFDDIGRWDCRSLYLHSLTRSPPPTSFSPSRLRPVRRAGVVVVQYRYSTVAKRITLA